MKVDRSDTTRFDLALDMFQQGKAFEFSNIQFYLNPSLNRVEVRTFTDWHVSNLTDDIAQTEVKRGLDAFEYLNACSQEFHQIVRGREIRYSVVKDSGNSSVEVCHLSGERIVWS